MYRLHALFIVVLSFLVACNSEITQPLSPNGTLQLSIQQDDENRITYFITKPVGEGILRRSPACNDRGV